MSKLAPIVLFVYNRPEHTKDTLTSLEKNFLASESDLYIFSDGAKTVKEMSNVNKVREIVKEFTGFKSVTISCSHKNNGLANSIIDGVTKIVNEYGKVIVLEDDLKTSNYFLTYMNDALNYFENKDVWSISGYTPPINFPSYYEKDVYAVMRACSWGWATWKEKWNLNEWKVKDFDKFIKNANEVAAFNKSGNDMSAMLQNQINGAIDSWAIRWCYNQFKFQQPTIYPVKSYLSNAGMEGESTHGSFSKKFHSEISDTYDITFEDVSKIDQNIVNEFAKNYNMRFYNHVGILLRKIGLYKIVKKNSKKLIRWS